MSEPTLYVRLDIPTPEGWEWVDHPHAIMVEGFTPFMLVPVEPVAVTVMNDYIDGFYQVADVYAPDLTNEAYKVAVVILGADDE